MTVEEQAHMILSRYMTFERFIDMCANGLSLPRATLFNDAWEGFPQICWNIIADQIETHRWNEVVRQQINLGNSSYSANDIDSIPQLPSLDNVRKAMSWIYVSCWHMAEEESMAMWKLYTQAGSGVCIQAELSKLAQAFSDTYQERNDLVIMARNVTYIKPGEKIDKVPPASFYYANETSGYISNFAHIAAVGGLSLKHSGHSFEKEFRVICDTFWLSDSEELTSCNGEDYIKVKIPRGFFQKIVLSPEATEATIELIREVLVKYKFDSCSVERSALDIEKFRHGTNAISSLRISDFDIQ